MLVDATNQANSIKMNRLCYVTLLILLSSCHQESSPEGRSKLRDEKIQLQIDELKQQNKALLDSISVINKKLR